LVQTPALAAREHGIPVFAPDTVNTPEWIERITALQPELILSVYYRNMISSKILALPGSAHSTFTDRSSRNIAGAPRSTGPSCTASRAWE